MSRYDFEINVENGRITARYEQPAAEDQRFGPVDLLDDPLTLESAKILEQWLKRWEWIGRLDTVRGVLVPGTFELLGRHLYRLILENEVGAALAAALDDVPDDEALRVLISFGAGAEDLAPLPWEFLYAPETAGRRGFYLATETKLILSRYLSLESPRKEIRVADELRVLFVVALPDIAEFDRERGPLLRLIDEFRRRRDAIDVDTVSRWDPDEVARELRTKTDIVHLVGVCRNGVERPELLLNTGDELAWVDTQQIVTTLTRPQANAPQLVILHLWERAEGPDPDGTFTESFERLAPLLAKEGIPAVLAMQYPMEPTWAMDFLRAFYSGLTAQQDIGRAVQSARLKMYSDKEGTKHRFFGTPVLYMQSVDGRLYVSASAAKTSPSAAQQPVQPVRGGGPTGALDAVLETLETEAPDAATADEVEQWAREQDWPADRDKARTLIQQRLRDDPDPRRRPMYAAMMKALRKG